MLTAIKTAIDAIRKNKQIFSFDEIRTKQEIILGVLHALGWNVFNTDEVEPEYEVSRRRVDYVLRVNKVNECFIEVKKVSEDLEKHQEQLLDYAFKEGIDLAALTNGVTWWLYLPLKKGSWEQRKFSSIDILYQDIDEASDIMFKILSKSNILSGKSLENAEDIFKSNMKQKKIDEFIPKAWKKIIEKPNKVLIDLIADKTEEMCGFKPDEKTVCAFMNKSHSVINPLSSSMSLSREEGSANSNKSIALSNKKGDVFDSDKSLEVYLKDGNITAKGLFNLKNGRLIVFEGSKANLKMLNNSDGQRRREVLIKNNIIIKDGNTYVFPNDYEFKSCSGAANQITGKGGSGYDKWKDKEGIPLSRYFPKGDTQRRRLS